MSFKKIVFSEPVESLSGKRNKNSQVCFFQGKMYGQRGWGMGKRNLVTRPYSTDEQAAQAKFTTRTKNVAARRKSSASTYPADMAAFLAQRDLPGGIKTFVKWLWADEKKKQAQG